MPKRSRLIEAVGVRKMREIEEGDRGYSDSGLQSSVQNRIFIMLQVSKNEPNEVCVLVFVTFGPQRSLQHIQPT